MNFGYDIIDQRGKSFPNNIAVRYRPQKGNILEITNGDLQHHSDVTAFYLRRMGIGKGSIVFLYDLQTMFEFTTILTALHKLYATPVFDLRQSPIERFNHLQAYAVIASNNSNIIDVIDKNLMSFKTLEIKISVGFPYVRNWFDLHTGTRMSGIFKPAKEQPQNYTSLIEYDDTPILYDQTYPFSTQKSFLWDRFYRSMRDNRIFEF